MERNTIVLLIAHNEKEKLQRSVESIRQWEEADDIRIVVVDNASEDGTKEWLSAQPDISFATEEKRVERGDRMLSIGRRYFISSAGLYGRSRLRIQIKRSAACKRGNRCGRTVDSWGE